MNVHLEIQAEKCTGCRICENFCSFHHEGAIWPARTRITLVAQSDDGPFVPTVCRKCEDALCAAACPVEAITRDEHTGAWVVDMGEYYRLRGWDQTTGWPTAKKLRQLGLEDAAERMNLP